MQIKMSPKKCILLIVLLPLCPESQDDVDGCDIEEFETFDADDHLNFLRETLQAHGLLWKNGSFAILLIMQKRTFKLIETTKNRKSVALSTNLRQGQLNDPKYCCIVFNN